MGMAVTMLEPHPVAQNATRVCPSEVEGVGQAREIRANGWARPHLRQLRFQSNYLAGKILIREGHGPGYSVVISGRRDRGEQTYSLYVRLDSRVL